VTNARTEAVLAQLAAHAALAREQAVALPLAAFTDPVVLHLERERIFADEWLCVGSTADVPAAG